MNNRMKAAAVLLAQVTGHSDVKAEEMVAALKPDTNKAKVPVLFVMRDNTLRVHDAVQPLEKRDPEIVCVTSLCGRPKKKRTKKSAKK